MTQAASVQAATELQVEKPEHFTLALEQLDGFSSVFFKLLW